MSFPLDIIPTMELLTERRILATMIVAENPHTTPRHEGLRQCQEKTQQGTLGETSLPDKEPLLNDLARVTMSIRAWRNVVETIHPSDRKKRIAREVDTMMREEINNPIGEIGATIWSTAVSEARVRDRDECMKSNMMPSPGVLDNAEEGSDDYITALPSILAHQLGQTPPKKRGKTLTKRKVRGSKHE